MSNFSVDAGFVDQETQDVKKGNSYGTEIVETTSAETNLLEDEPENTENTSAEETDEPVLIALGDEDDIEQAPDMELDN